VNAVFSLGPTTAATITPGGVLSAAAIVTNQTVTVNASYTEGSVTETASMSVTIVGRIIPMALTIQGAASVNCGGTSNYTALASFNDGSQKDVNAVFSLSSTSAANISAGGVLSTGAVTSDQAVTVDAYYAEGDITVNASMQVTINVEGMFGLSRGFNNFGELASELTEIAGQNIYAYALTRDQSGSIVSKMETIGAVSSQYAYSYDTAGRLTSVTLNGQVIEEYQYGANGTRTYEQNAMRGIVRALSYSDEDYLLTAGNTSYQYDIDGFLRTRTSGTQVTIYSYSTLGELLSVALPDGTLIDRPSRLIGLRAPRSTQFSAVYLAGLSIA
jgi:YD repeat-containing protein